MKRLFLVFSILLANLAAFAGPIDDNCSTIYDSIIAGDISKAEDAASKVYAQKSACSATNLADLAIIYHQLVDKSSEAVTPLSNTQLRAQETEAKISNAVIRLE